MGYKAIGFDTLGYDLEKLLEGLSPDSIKKALQNGSEPIMQAMTESAPVKTGRLKAAFATGKINKKGDRYYLKMGVLDGKGAPHAHLVERGHGGPHPAPPHPFARPAFDANVEEAYSRVADTLREEQEK